MRHKVDGEHAHRRAIHFMCPFREDIAPSTALAENLEGRDALHAVEEIRAQNSIGRAPSTAALLAAPEEDGGSHKGKDGEKEKDKADREIYGNHERKNNDRGQTGYDHLREKLAEKNLQPLDTFAQYSQYISSPALVELSRPHGEGMLE